MKFLVDAQLPRRAVAWFTAAGCHAVHTADLQNGNRTKDGHVAAWADQHGMVVVTKDSDFVDSHLLRGIPAKLLLVSTGNIGNPQLESLLVPQMPVLVREFGTHSFLELGVTGLIVRD